MSHNRFVLALAVIGLACAPARRRPAAPNDEIRLPASSIQLRNGLTVIVLPDPRSPLVEVDVRYAVGAAEDPDDKEGLAHLVEHYTFLSRPEGADGPSLMALLRQATLVFNAYTDLDSTHYMNLVGRDQVEVVLSLEAARMALDCTTIDEATFAREREVVRNEAALRGGTDEGARLLRDIYGAGHPYAHSVGGSDAGLQALVAADACRFHADHYTPGRAVIVVAGDVSVSEIEAYVARYFGAIPGRDAPARKAIAPVPLIGGRVEREADVDDTVVTVAWALPARHSADDALAELAASRLLTELPGIAVRVGGQRAPILLVSATLRKKDSVDKVVKRVLEAARAIGDDVHVRHHRGWRTVSPRAAPRALVLQLLSGLDDLSRRTRLYADYAQFGGVRYFTGELARIRAIDQKAMRRFVRGWLAPDSARVVVLTPRAEDAKRRRPRPAAAPGGAIEVERRDEVDVDPAEARAHLIVPVDVIAVAPVRKFTLDNGLSVILQPTPSAVPLATVELVVGAGWADEPAGQAGVAEMAGFVFVSGAANPRRRRVRYRFDTVEEAFRGVSAAATSTTITDRTVAGLLPVALAQIAERLEGGWQARLIGQFLDLARKQSKEPDEDLEELLRRPVFVAQRRFSQALYGKEHPYARDSFFRRAETLERLEAKHVLAFLKGHFVAANATLIVAGRFDASAVEQQIREQFAKARRGTPAARQDVRPEPPAGAVALGVEDDEAGQVSLLLGFPVAVAVDGQYPARLVLSELLDLRMRAIRERLGAAYSVHARLDARGGPGAYVVEGAVNAARAGEALEFLRGNLAALRAGEGFEADFVLARRAVLRRLIARSGTAHEAARVLAFNIAHRLPDDFHERAIRQVAALSPAQLRELIAAELDPAAEVIVLVGTHDEVEAAYRTAGLFGRAVWAK